MTVPGQILKSGFDRTLLVEYSENTIVMVVVKGLTPCLEQLS